MAEEMHNYCKCAAAASLPQGKDAAFSRPTGIATDGETHVYKLKSQVATLLQLTALLQSGTAWWSEVAMPIVKRKLVCQVHPPTGYQYRVVCIW